MHSKKDDSIIRTVCIVMSQILHTCRKRINGKMHYNISCIMKTSRFQENNISKTS